MMFEDKMGELGRIEKELEESTSIRFVNSSRGGFAREYYCLQKDIDKLPVVDCLETGSHAFIMDTMEVLFYDESEKRWIEG